MFPASGKIAAPMDSQRRIAIIELPVNGDRSMHILKVTLTGLVVLALFYLVSRFVLKNAGLSAQMANAFFGVWLLYCAYNFYNGAVNHGIPVLNEIAAFVPMFGIPAGLAWYLSRWT